MKVLKKVYRFLMGVGRSQKGFKHPVRRPKELDAYEGLWVAMKDGKVVAKARTSRELVYEVHKKGPEAEGAVAQFVSKPSKAAMVGVG